MGKTIQIAFTVYFFSIFFYNFFACLVTFMLNSVWHAILDNFRPLTVWITDLYIYYYVIPSLGEAWTIFSWIQVGGMVVLLYGTAIYNAPFPGSVLLKGEWYSLGMDFSKEYLALSDEQDASMIEEAFRASAMGTPMSPRSPNRRMSSLRAELAASLR